MPDADAPNAGDRLARVPRLSMAGLPIAVLGMEATARLLVETALSRPRGGRPLHFSSANGEVLSRCHREPDVARLFADADLISADGQPMVVASRVLSRTPLPERVATTDLFHVAAREAVRLGASFYLLGATEEENRRAAARAAALHPELRILGRSHGFHQGSALHDKLAEIDALRPDVLWLALGVPREQAFVRAHGRRLPHVGAVKTAGGLFNFLSGTRRRAPAVVQAAGLEWAWRLAQEPRRLLKRYAVTNPHAAILLLTRTG